MITFSSAALACVCLSFQYFVLADLFHFYFFNMRNGTETYCVKIANCRPPSCLFKAPNFSYVTAALRVTVYACIDSLRPYTQVGLSRVVRTDPASLIPGPMLWNVKPNAYSLDLRGPNKSADIDQCVVTIDILSILRLV